MPTNRRLRIFDTTLRDGEAAPGNTMTATQKVKLGLRLEALGVDVIEPGFPAASPIDFGVVSKLSRQLTRATINLFCRASRADIELSLRALEGGTAPYQMQILTVGSDIHLEFKRRMTRREAIEEAVDSVRYASALGVDHISIAPEDATRGDPTYLREIITASVEAGADMVGIPDTCGAMLPQEFADLVHSIREWVGPEIGLSVHCHDDMGLAVANSLAAVTAGADEIQTTLCGIGERAGNAALEELVSAILYKPKALHVETGIDESQLFGIATDLIESIELPTARHKSVIGANVFATQAGLHQAGIVQNPITYEYLEPERFGRQRTLLIGRQSGRSALRYILEQAGHRPSSDDIEALYKLYTSREDTCACATADEVVLRYNQLADRRATMMIDRA